MGEKVFILSLGCAKNQVDSENLAGMMVSEGFEIVDTPDLADIALVN
ncbi:MAG: 30S ribosomal protein S12 methylthiotransferase RimO, partial [Acetomicrobium sp.]